MNLQCKGAFALTRFIPMAHSSPAAQGSQAGGVVLIEHLPSMCKAGG